MTQILKPQVLVVGGGPGGYVAAIRCGQLGLDTVLVDSDGLGGTCLNRGCIPSKALIHTAHRFADIVAAVKTTEDGISISSKPTLDFKKTMAWKNGVVSKLNMGVGGLLKRAKVKVIHGWAHFSDGKTALVKTDDYEIRINPVHIILATGSSPVGLPSLPFGGNVMSSTEALSLAEVPKTLAIVGAGYIGLELGGAFAKLGSKVTVVEAADRILAQYDAPLVAPVKEALDKMGVTFHLGAKASKYEKGHLVFEGTDGTSQKVKADKVLVTIGRGPRTEGWGLENMPIKMQGRFVKVDETCATSCKDVYAIGDLVGDPMLAHKASAQGEMVAEIIAGEKRRFDPVAIPSVCFTTPEIVSVGAGPETPDTHASVVPLKANGRSLIVGGMDCPGFVRIISSKSTHRIVGVQAVGHHIAELCSTFTHAVEMGSVLEDIAGIIHAHPTLGETFHEASLKALGMPIHS